MGLPVSREAVLQAQTARSMSHAASWLEAAHTFLTASGEAAELATRQQWERVEFEVARLASLAGLGDRGG